MRVCSICSKEINAEKAPILAMGGFGNPKYLCDECAADIDTAIGARDAEKIEEAMSSISKKLSATGAENELVIETVKEIFTEAGERARKIKEGTFDFSAEERASPSEEPEYEIPEELLETEEDREQDARDLEKAKRLDKIFNWIATGIIAVAAVLILVYMLAK